MKCFDWCGRLRITKRAEIAIRASSTSQTIPESNKRLCVTARACAHGAHGMLIDYPRVTGLKLPLNRGSQRPGFPSWLEGEAGPKHFSFPCACYDRPKTSQFPKEATRACGKRQRNRKPRST